MMISFLEGEYPALYIKVLKYQSKEGTLDMVTLAGSFTWKETIEGYEFWSRIDSGNFTDWESYFYLNDKLNDIYSIF